MTMQLPPSPANRAEAAKAAMLSAFVIPGAGQVYNRQWAKGIFVGAVFLVSSVATLIPLTVGVVGYYLAIGQGDVESAGAALQSILAIKNQVILLALVSLLLYIYSVVDAYRTGKQWTPAEDGKANKINTVPRINP